jgi:hypothetical protein
MEKYGWGMWQVKETGVVHIGFWWEDLKERKHWEDPCVDERITL